MDLSVIVLAAGQGTRMHSQLPKVLHRIAGISMLERVVSTASELNPANVHVVVGHQSERVKSTLAHLDVHWVEQKEQLGTGHAVLQAMPDIDASHRVLVLYGDVPVISKATLEDLIDSTPGHGVGVITALYEEPGSLGRIIRDHSGNFKEIIEFKDATPEQQATKEINSGIYLMPADLLKAWLPKLSNDNAQEEYYLTDALSMAVRESVSVVTVTPQFNEEVMGVNDRLQQAELERYFQYQAAKDLMRQGVTVLDPHRLDVRGQLLAGDDVVIDLNVLFKGTVTLGRNCYIGPNCVIKNSHIGDNVRIAENSVIEDTTIEQDCNIGPFARLRPGSEIRQGARIGNFVEVKKSVIGKSSKVNHLTYIGDATIGEGVNVGAHTVTCNYDGVNKYQTKVGDRVFIGSGTQLVAPVEVGDDAFIGAGSTITKNAPEDTLTLSRSRQTTVQGWQSPIKRKKESCVE